MSPTIRRRPEKIGMAALLSLVGGYLDAHTFVGRGGVFANAQTGNVVLLGVNAADRHWMDALAHVVPLVAFVAGLLGAELLARPSARRVLRRPTRAVLIVEVTVLAAVGFVPGSDAQLAVTSAVALVAALQVSTFTLVRDVSYNTTMTTGNLRRFVTAVYTWQVDRSDAARQQAMVLGVVVGSFLGGAVVGAVLTDGLGAHAVWFAAGVLLVVLGWVVVETRTLERQVSP